MNQMTMLFMGAAAGVVVGFVLGALYLSHLADVADGKLRDANGALDRVLCKWEEVHNMLDKINRDHKWDSDGLPARRT